MQKRKFLFIFFLVIFTQSIFAASNIYWLRGDDISANLEGGDFSFMSSTPASSNSNKTIKEFEVEQGTGELTRWYSSKFPTDFLLSGEILFFASDFELVSGNAQYRLVLYEFDSVSEQSNFISESDWFNFEDKFQEASLPLETSFVIKSQNRMKLVLEYNLSGGTSKIQIVLDEPESFNEFIWITPQDQSFSAFGVKNTAAILMDVCGVSSVACSNDLDCDDFSTLTTDTCSNPGTCNSSCVFTSCDTGCFTSAQCSDEDPLTLDSCEGFGLCSAFCENSLCEVSCFSNPTCGDGNPNTLDQCVFPNTCLSFCLNTPCTGDECFPVDINVCGNGVCEFEEECELDCEMDRKIELIDVTNGEYFLYGDKVIVKAKVTGFFLPVTVKMNGFFGEIELTDDSRGVDKRANDKIFSGFFTITQPAYDLESVTITATDGPNTISLVKHYVVAPFLELKIKTDKQNYYVTDKIIVTAFALKKGALLTKDLVLKIENSSGEKIVEQNVSPNSNGLYNFNYALSSFDTEGELKITGSISDELGNIQTSTTSVFFFKSWVN